MSAYVRLFIALVLSISSVISSVICFINDSYHWILSFNGLLLGLVSLLAFVQSYEKLSDI